MRCIAAGLALFLAASTAAGCSGNDESAGAGGRDAAAGEPDGDIVSCAAPGDPVDTYHANLTKPGTNGVLTFTLLDSDNAPPLRGINTWHLRVTKADKSLETGPVVGELRMPASRMHPPQIQPETTFDASQGLYVATPIYFFVAGYWSAEFTVFETNADAGPPLDRASFYFCIE